MRKAGVMVLAALCACGSAGARTQAPVADLGVTIDAPVRVVSGQRFAFTVTISNAGPDAAQAVELTHRTTATTIYQYDVASSQGACGPVPGTAGGEVFCQLGSISSGQSVTATLSVLPFGGQGTIGDEVSVTSATTDNATANNRAVARTTVRSASSPRRFQGRVSGVRSGPGHRFGVGDGLHVEFRDRARQSTSYRVCWALSSGRDRRCWNRRTGKAGAWSRISTPAPQRLGTYVVRWYLGGRAVARWSFRNGAQDVWHFHVHVDLAPLIRVDDFALRYRLEIAARQGVEVVDEDTVDRGPRVAAGVRVRS